MATIEQLINAAEERKRSAERTVSDSKNALKRFFDSLEAAGIKDHEVSEEQAARGDTLGNRHREAIDEVKRGGARS